VSQSTVERWLSRRLVTLPMPEKFSLRHANLETGETDLIERVEIPKEGGNPGELARAIASTLYERAREHAGAWPGRPQLFRVSALVKGKSEGTFAFRARVEGRSSDMALAEGSEPPTAAGITSQHMRFTEAAIRIALEANAETIDSLRQDVKSLREERERDNDRRMKFIATYEDMMDRRAERDIELRKFESNSQRKDLALAKVIETVMPSLAGKIPHVIDAVLGSGPSAKDVLAKVFRVLSSMSPEDREGMLRKLPSEAKKDLEALADMMAPGETDG
jgi:hypothetical protein